MTLTEKLQTLYSPLLALENCTVSHYRRGKAKPPFVIWSETGEDASFNADNHKREQQLTGLVDFYSLKEFDPIADSIQAILNAEPIGYTLANVLYEEETNLIHYQWRWWTIG